MTHIRGLIVESRKPLMASFFLMSDILFIFIRRFEERSRKKE